LGMILAPFPLAIALDFIYTSFEERSTRSCARR
jgi:hypothetical protein